jgi:hypothetical protein
MPILRYCPAIPHQQTHRIIRSPLPHQYPLIGGSPLKVLPEPLTIFKFHEMFIHLLEERVACFRQGTGVFGENPVHLIHAYGNKHHSEHVLQFVLHISSSPRITT